MHKITLHTFFILFDFFQFVLHENFVFYTVSNISVTTQNFLF